MISSARKFSPSQGPRNDDFIGPPAGLADGWRLRAGTCLWPQCRAGVFARRGALAPPQDFRDDASIVPYGGRARFCRALQDIFAANRQCTPPSAPCGASTSPCRGGFVNGFHPKGSPVRGAVGVSRLRGAAPCLASILLGWHQARRRAWRMAGVCALLPARGGFVGRAISPAAGALRHRRVSGTMRASSPTEAGQGPAGPCRIFLPLTGNAPLRLRLTAHPPPLAGEALEGAAALRRG